MISALTRARKSSVAAQSLPVGRSGAPNETETAPERGNQLPPRRIERVPRSPAGTTGSPVRAGDEESSQTKLAQSRPPVERALRKEHRRGPRARGLLDPAHILHSLPGVEALHQHGVDSEQEQPRDPALCELALGDEYVSVPRRKHRAQHDSIDVAHMIGRHQVRPVGEILEPGRVNADAGQGRHQSSGPVADNPPQPRPAHERHQRPSRDSNQQQHGPGIARIQQRGSRTQRAPQLGDHRAQGEACELQGDRDGARARSAPFVVLAAGRAPNLAAGGLEHRVRGRQHDIVRRQTDQIDSNRLNVANQALARRRVGLPGLRQHDQALGPARWVRAREHGNATLANARSVADRQLQVLRVDVAPAADDQVLYAAGDVDLAVGAVGIVARVQPLIMEQLAGLLWGCGSNRP